VARELRKLAAILFADAVGSSRLMGRDESGTVARLLEHLNRRLAPAATRRGGRVVRLKGDGSLVEFVSAVDALAAAIEFQQAMVEANRGQPDDQAIVFRVGLHLGDVIVEGDDIYGDAINVAARLEAEAPSGGILVSRAVREAVTGRLKVSLHAVGELALKNIERPIRAFRAEWSAEDWPAHSRASEAAASSKTPAPALALPELPSIAVLPFQNMSGDPEQEYFVDGLVEDITSALSKFRSLFVIARNSAFTYKGKPVDVRQVSRELGVRYLLEGSVRKASDRLRISGQLIDTVTGNQVWANRYDGALADVFDLQDSITSNVAAVIAPKVQRAEIERAQTKSTDSLTAYDLYLRALALRGELKYESYGQALALLDRAVTRDPNFSAAYGLAAMCCFERDFLAMTPDAADRERGLQAAMRAVETGNDNPEALARGGLVIAHLGGRPEEGLLHLERAIALNPNSLLALAFAAQACVMLGTHEKAMALYEQAMRISPLGPMSGEAYFGVAQIYFFTGRFEQAIAWANKSLAVTRARHIPLMVKIAAMGAADRPRDELQEAVQHLLALMPGVTIKGFRQRLRGYRQVDAEKAEAAMRKAGLPE